MEQLLSTLRGKKVDINCGASSAFRGEILGTEQGILKLEDEEKKVFYIAVDRIIAVCETSDHAARPGFIG